MARVRRGATSFRRCILIVLAGDIGGTNTRLALFEVKSEGERRVFKSITERTYPSAGYPSLDVIVETFLKELGDPAVDRACIGIAGPVENNVCRATNLPWVVEGRHLQLRLNVPRVLLVNDFHAAAMAVTSMDPEHLAALGGGPPVPRGPIAVLGAGTGLGQAFLVWSGAEGRYQVIPSEGGHVDLAPRTPLEVGLFGYLTAKYGRVSCERVLSGQGLVDIFSFLSLEPACQGLVRPETAAALAAYGEGNDPPAVISRRALDGSDPVCEMALALFCSMKGAIAGNLALMVLATGGVYVAGGIAPRILPYLRKGPFREAFERKGRLSPLVARMPAYVVMHPQPGLLGAATIAAGV